MHGAHRFVRTRGINSTEEAHQYTSENGDKYFVDSTILKCGKRIERGHILFANGDKYEGDWTQVRNVWWFQPLDGLSLSAGQ